MSAVNAIEANLVACYPERAIAGFSRVDATFLFYSYITALVTPASVVLDLGAGRGAFGQTAGPSYKRHLSIFKGRVARIVGVDVDDAVKENPFLDDAVVIQPGGSLPFPDNTFDVIFSDWVLEHVDEPTPFVRELERVLKPGGWFCARTPNKFGPIAIGATLIPNKLHTKVLKVLQPGRQEIDVFPTRYRLNTLSAVRKHFPAARWRNCSFAFGSEVMYLARSRLLLKLSSLFSRIAPPALQPVLLVFVQKKAA